MIASHQRHDELPRPVAKVLHKRSAIRRKGLIDDRHADTKRSKSCRTSRFGPVTAPVQRR